MRDLYEAVSGEVEKVVVGQEQMTATALAAVSLGGHVLLEGPPGVAKTLLASALSRALGLDFRRIQFTPDMLPSDVTGNVALRGGELIFRRGPVFTNVLLADEINRTPPKTQAALLEAMQERQVSVEGRPEPLPDPFLVVATQNPIEYEGTYPLPEAQLDRFLVRLARRLSRRGAGAGDARPRAPRRRVGRPRPRAAGRRAGRAARGARRRRRHARGRRDRPLRDRRHPAHARPAERPLGASPRAAVHLLGARRRRRGSPAATTSPPTTSGTWRRPSSPTGSCSHRRPSSSATGHRRGPHGPRRGARAAMSPAPRAAAFLAAVAVLTAVTSPAVGALAALVLVGAVAADALAVRRRPEVARQVPRHLARGVSAPLRVTTERGGPGRVRLRQPAPAA